MQLKRDDDEGAFDDFAFSPARLWSRTPADNTPDNPADPPKYARSGLSSWFAFDPDPEIDEVASSAMASGAFVVPRSQPTYLHFNHAYVFEYYPSGGASPASYLDGGQVLVQTLAAGRWTTRPVTYVNGPKRTMENTGAKIFGGDSHGYGSTRVDLSSLGGQTARVVFRVSGDEDTSYIGWWVDDIRLFTCPNEVASAPRTTVAAGTTTARVSWQPPTYVGPGHSGGVLPGDPVHRPGGDLPRHHPRHHADRPEPGQGADRLGGRRQRGRPGRGAGHGPDRPHQHGDLVGHQGGEERRVPDHHQGGAARHHGRPWRACR